MPHADKIKVHCICSSAHSELVGKPAPGSLQITIWNYIRDRYISFKSLDRDGSKESGALSEMRQRTQKTEAFWRGEE